MTRAVPRDRPFRARPRAALLLALGLAFAAIGCGDDPVRVTDDVIGTWTTVGEDGGREYIRITESELDVFSEEPFADCFERTPYEILEIDGVAYRVTDQTDTFSVELRRDEENLRVAAFGVSVDYSPTTIDPQTLAQCVTPNPGVACADAPALLTGSTVAGSLAITDAANDDGSRYDAYRIQVEVAVDLVLDMRSPEIDSYLYLFSETGALIARNDDASNRTLNASIEASLDPGCYLVMATSAAPAEFGEYVLELTSPATSPVEP
ncbi:MAG TPA: hypothetical protein VMN78_10320 [Longimicrobiales bacterium]|nr:hypothetical protein [Longimicrobiales bacterium]